MAAHQPEAPLQTCLRAWHVRTTVYQLGKAQLEAVTLAQLGHAPAVATPITLQKLRRCMLDCFPAAAKTAMKNNLRKILQFQRNVLVFSTFIRPYLRKRSIQCLHVLHGGPKQLYSEFHHVTLPGSQGVVGNREVVGLRN